MNLPIYYRAQEVLEKYCSFMPVEIYLSNPNAEPVNTTTIPEDEVTEKDTVIEHIVEDAAKTEEDEKEDGTKETVEKFQPEKKKAKIVKRPVSISDTTSSLDKAS